jgi:hypothetical protein
MKSINRLPSSESAAFVLALSSILISGCGKKESSTDALQTELVKSNEMSPSAPPGPKPPTQGLLTGWDLTSDSIDVAALFVGGSGPVMPQRVWIKRDTDHTYLLVQAKGLKDYMARAQGPVIFLELLFDSDGDPKTGGSKTIAGQVVSGFDVSADLSTMQVQDKDGKIESVLNCQVAKWDGTQFSGNLAWGTQFNKEMSASFEGDYALFMVPRSILEVTQKGDTARIALNVPDAQYGVGKQPMFNLKIHNK